MFADQALDLKHAMEIIDLQWGQSICLWSSARTGKYCSLVASQSGPGDDGLLTKPSRLSHVGQRSGSKVIIAALQSVAQTANPPMNQVSGQLDFEYKPTKDVIKNSKDSQLAKAPNRADIWASFGWVNVFN